MNKRLTKKEMKKLNSLIDDLRINNRELWCNIIIDNVATDYYCSNFGRIVSVRKNKKDTSYKIKLIKGIRMPSGYYVVTIYYNGKANREYIHRVVATCFIPITHECDKSLLQVNHINGHEKWNNTTFNLEWVTDSENKKHGHETGLYKSGEESHRSKYNTSQIEDVCEYLLSNKYSATKISELTGVSVGVVYDIRNKGSWHHIVDKYDFSNCKWQQCKYEKETIDKVKELLKLGSLTPREISNITGIPIKIVYYYRNKNK